MHNYIRAMDIYLQSFVSKLRVRDGIFEVTVPDMTGANRHIIEQFAPHEISSILLQKGTSASADALLLALEHGVDVLILWLKIFIYLSPG